MASFGRKKRHLGGRAPVPSQPDWLPDCCAALSPGQGPGPNTTWGPQKTLHRGADRARRWRWRRTRSRPTKSAVIGSIAGPADCAGGIVTATAP